MNEKEIKFSSIDKESMSATQRSEKIGRATCGSPLYGLTMIDPQATPRLWNTKQNTNNTYLSSSALDNGANLYWHFTADNGYDESYVNDKSTLEQMELEYLLRVAYVNSVSLKKFSDDFLYKQALNILKKRQDDSPGFKGYLKRAKNHKQLQKIFNEKEEKYFNQLITDDPSEAHSSRFTFDNDKMEEIVKEKIGQINKKFSQKKFSSKADNASSNIIKENYVRFLKNAGTNNIFKTDNSKTSGELHLLKESIEKVRELVKENKPMNIREHINEQVKDNPSLKKAFEDIEDLSLGLETPSWVSVGWENKGTNVNYFVNRVFLKNKNKEIMEDLSKNKFGHSNLSELSSKELNELQAQASETPKTLKLSEDIVFHGTDKEISRQYREFQKNISHDDIKKINNLEALSLYDVENSSRMNTSSPRSSLTNLLSIIGTKPRGMVQDENALRSTIVEILAEKLSDNKDELEENINKLNNYFEGKTISQMEDYLDNSSMEMYLQKKINSNSPYMIEGMEKSKRELEREIKKIPTVSPNDPNRDRKLAKYETKKSKLESDLKILNSRINKIKNIRENLNKSLHDENDKKHMPINHEDSFFRQYDEICNHYMNYMIERYGKGMFLKWSAFHEDADGNLSFSPIYNNDKDNRQLTKNPYLPKTKTGGLKQIIVSVQYADGFEEIPQLARTNLAKVTAKSLTSDDVEYIKQRIEQEGLNKIVVDQGISKEEPITSEEIVNFLQSISANKVLVYRIDINQSLKNMDGTLPANLRFHIGDQTAQGRASTTREMIRQVTFDGGETYIPLKGRGFERPSKGKDDTVENLSNTQVLPGHENNIKYVVQRAMDHHSININEEFILSQMPSTNDFKPLNQDLMSESFIQELQQHTSAGSYIIAPSEQKKLQKYLLELNKNITGTSDELDVSFQNEEETLVQENIVVREVKKDKLEDMPEQEEAAEEVEDFYEEEQIISEDELNSLLNEMMQEQKRPGNIVDIDVDKEISLINMPEQQTNWQTLQPPRKLEPNTPLQLPEEEEENTYTSSYVSSLLRKYSSSKDGEIKQKLISIINFIINKKDKK